MELCPMVSKPDRIDIIREPNAQMYITKWKKHTTTQTQSASRKRLNQDDQYESDYVRTKLRECISSLPARPIGENRQ